jgi:starch phosphorylase
MPELAYNLWWSWYSEAQALFEQIDPDHWQKHRNPVRLLRERSAALQRLARNVEFVAAYQQIISGFEAYMNEPDTWYAASHPDYRKFPVAYFSAEFGLHECLPVYCGGLGVLAGDHLKTASDLGVPLIGVGLLYKNGYFVQRIDASGRQLAEYPKFDFANLPVLPLRQRNGRRLVVTVDLAGRRVAAQCWSVRVGRTQILLLDADFSRNHPTDRKITAQLYGGDREMRVSQEILLGVGGVRVLRVLGIAPRAWHLNEGHVAFVCFERLRELMQEKKLDFDHAVEAITASTVFTTHTPVVAGNEAFNLPLMDKYFRRFAEQCGIELSRWLNLGLQTGSRGEKFFSMTVMALRLSNVSNGVSKLHGKVSRALWKHLWPEIPEAESPITSITNGIHADTWLAPEMGKLFKRHLGEDWRLHLDDGAFWQDLSRIPDEELWQVHQLLKWRLINFVRRRLAQQLKRNGASERQIIAAAAFLNPEALTMGFARRFASYKRADLIFSDLERLEHLVKNARRPIQILFAGKAHPHDKDGQAILRRVYQMTQRKNFLGKIILLEDYDMNVGRHLVQGVDVWLNNPRRPMEASGTSGQKVPLNGGINCSILDGWWAEGYNGENGWAIGKEEGHFNEAAQDRADALALYQVLEKEVVPLFYRRDRRGLPRQWVQKMKASMTTLIPQFNTKTMLKNYIEQLYIPTLQRHEFFESDGFATAAEMAKIKEHLRENWPLVHVTHAAIEPRVTAAQRSGKDNRKQSHNGKLDISAGVYLGELHPDLVQVELFCATPQQNGTPETIKAIPMQAVSRNHDGVCCYRLELTGKPESHHTWRIRVLPRHPALSHKHELGLIHWWEL